MDLDPEKSLMEIRQKALEHQATGQYGEALLGWRSFLLREPDDLAALNNMAIILRSLGRIAEAEATLKIALERHPTSAELWISLAMTLDHWGVTEQTRDAFEKAVMLDDGVSASMEFSRFLASQGLLHEAQSILSAAALKEPDNAYLQASVGDMWRERAFHEEAIRAYDLALTIKPDFPTAQFGRGLSQLACGFLHPQSWEDFEKRPQTGALHGDIDVAGKPKWDGRPLEKRILLVKCEGGLSETLQFMRMLRWIKDGIVWVECQPELHNLIRTARLPVELVPLGQDELEFDCWCSLLSLGDLLQVTSDDVGGAVPYIRHDPASLAIYRKRLGSGLNIGISWHGNNRRFGRGERVIPLEAFAPLSELPDVHLISLQKGEGRAEVGRVPFGIIDFTEELDDGMSAFIDTVTVMKALTLVVTTDNAIAHLAGALGVPVWVATPGASDWRWGGLEEETPWYPTMDLYHLAEGEDWYALFARMKVTLLSMMGGEESPSDQ